jgi:hypothetical protein
MAGSVLSVKEQPVGEQGQIDCVEIYLPKSIEFLSELYQFLRERVTIWVCQYPQNLVVFKGLSRSLS